jgi:hypothetical protein
VVDLSPAQLRELRTEYGSHHQAAVEALKSGLFTDEFRMIGVWLVKRRDGSHTFPRPHERYEALFWNLVWEAHVQPARRGAKTLGVPERELWWIIERRLELGEDASREWLALQTKNRAEFEYVPRPRLSPLVDWIDAHKEAARSALRLRRIPSEFRAGKLGWVAPAD